MTRPLLITLLILLCGGPAYAEWVEIGYTDGAKGYTLYADPETIRRKGDLVKMWFLFDFKLAQRAGDTTVFYLSDRMQVQVDCVEESYRQLAYTRFSHNMATGDMLVNNSDEGKWSPIAPGTIGQSILKVTCGKK